MSEEKEMNVIPEVDALARHLMVIFGNVTNTELFIKLMNDGMELIGQQMNSVVEACDMPDRRIAALIGRQAAYRDLRSAALRALELASGKPPQGETKESAGGSVL